MAKSTGLGDALWFGGYDISNDTNSVQKIACPTNMADVTGIDKLAHERLPLQRDGDLQCTVYFNKTGAHVPLSALPRTDTIATYAHGAALGGPAACINAKEIDYAPTRAADGSLLINVDAQANGFGLEWGVLLTPGKRTDSAATNGTALDQAAQSTFGGQAYLQMFAMTGTDVTVKLQDSADNVSFADLAGAAFTQITTTTPQAQRIAISNAATVRRYVRAVTVTTGGFTSLTFAVMFNRNPVAGVAF